jgi:fibronectin-binding autotransporter adhesin
MGLRTARADLTWDPSGNAGTTGTPTDGSGTWDTTLVQWYDGTMDNAWVNANFDGAIFGNGGAAGTLTLGTNINVGNITFNQTSGTTAYTIGNAPGDHVLTIADGSLINNNNTAGTTVINSTVVSSVGGTGGFTVVGPGNLSFNADVGTSTVQAPTVTMNGSGVLTFTGTADNFGMNLIANSGTTILAKTVGGHAIGGTLTVSGGLVQLGSAGDNIYDGAGVVITSGTFDLNGHNETVGGVTAGFGFDTGSSIINSLAGSNSVLTGDINRNGNNGVFNAGGDGNLTLQNIANAGSKVTKIGAGTLTLTGGIDNNSVAVVATSGTVILAKTSTSGVHAVGAGLTVQGALVQLGGTGGDQIYDGTGITITSGTFDMNGMNETVSGVTAGIATASTSSLINSVAGTTSVLTGDVNRAGNNGLFSAGGAGNLTLTNVASGGSTITKVGAGTLTLTGALDNVSLAINVNIGTVVLAKTSASGVHGDGGPLNVQGGTLQLGGTGGDQIYDGAFVTVNSGTFDLNGLTEGINVLAGSGGTVVNNNSGTTATLTLGTMNGGGQNYSGVIADHAVGTGVLALVKTGTGQQILSGNNTFSGGTTINGGTIQFLGDAQFGAVPAVPTVNITLNGGELFNNNSSPNLNVNRTLSLGSGGGFIEAGYGPANNFTVNGKITGVGGMGVAWDGQPLIFTNPANDYAGDTTIGTIGNTFYGPGSALLQFGVNNALPFGAGKGNVVFGVNPTTPAANATLDLHGFNGQINGLIGGTNAIVDNTTGTGSLTIGNNNVTSTFAGVIRNSSGTLAISKTGLGTLILTGANTYAGGTTINGGTLLAKNLSSSGATGSNPVTINAGGLLGGGAVGTATAGNFNVNGLVVVSPGTSSRGGTISAGASSLLSPGQTDTTADLTTGGQTWTGGSSDGSTGGVFAWKLNLSNNSTGATYQSGTLNAAKTGANWDELSVPTLSVAASPTSQFNIQIIGLGTASTSSTGAAGTAFNPNLSYQWVALNLPSTNTMTGVTPANFHIDATNVPANVNGFFSVGSLTTFNDTDPGFLDVVISYSPAPEPTSLLLLAAGAGGLLLRRRRPMAS